MEQGWASTPSKNKIEFFAQKTSLFSGRQLAPSLRRRRGADGVMLTCFTPAHAQTHLSNCSALPCQGLAV